MPRPAARMADRRSFGRRETAIAAVVIVDGETRRNCIVRNFSSVGALLEFQGRFEAPERFVLMVDGSQVEGGCLRQHQTGNKVGVSFRDIDIAKVLIREYQARLADTTVNTAGEIARSRPTLSVVPVSACALREQLLQKPTHSKLAAKIDTRPVAQEAKPVPLAAETEPAPKSSVDQAAPIVGPELIRGSGARITAKCLRKRRESIVLPI